MTSQCSQPEPLNPNHNRAETRTRIVVLLTAVMMVIEIAAGILYGSMALLADGWHMATHVGAFGITLFAYSYARRHANNPRFSYGTGKVSVLGGFASAVALGVVAAVMIVESVMRFFQPHQIAYSQAMLVAVIGLVVNLVSGWLLHQGHNHHDHDHHGHTHHHDHNLRAAYMHVLADALTSVLAIIALFFGRKLGWIWMDALMGIVGAVVILRWAYGLIKDTSGILLDSTEHDHTAAEIRAALTDQYTQITDLHVWPLAPGRNAASVCVVASKPLSPTQYKAQLSDVGHLSHVVIEVSVAEP
ncbi:CDF family Co(II)/Ni(II) efflux transporter DmeF [Gilvimarinus polysaccharolyticus]|uniref:CDF family Co(II)/Ni(II) efflux transporter DmeF n=1 Tax=Gilvimarinus polysaccharolyticus TaxID=863921 RepID=UPI000673C47A|nr:CDF family Co(II)/Ni(II) efflux transporter DmeF [Gilvimarinus polysaccharolyticus]